MNFHVFEMWIGMNIYDHRNVLALLKQHRERPEKFRPDPEFEQGLHFKYMKVGFGLKPKCRSSHLTVKLHGKGDRSFVCFFFSLV